MLRLLNRSIVLIAVCLGLMTAAPLAATTPVTMRDGTPLREGAKVDLADLNMPIPSFARQTNLPCNVCHTSFPQLTAFGRAFKLNGYTMVGMQQVKTQEQGAGSLALDVIPPVSVMAQATMTRVAKTIPGTQNSTAAFPQEFSLFVGEAITPHVGTFIQFTYGGADGSFGFDNAEIRYANHTQLASKQLTYGVTLNNNPTVQDVWNSTPAWGYPFAGSEAAPGPNAAPLISDALAQEVLGLGAYAYWDNTVYLEFTGYRSAPQGAPSPADATSEGTIKGLTPYWRLALTHAVGPQSIEVGTFGLSSRLYPSGIAGPTDRYTDVGLDAQYQRPVGAAVLTARASWIHEKQTLDASYLAGDAANPTNTLNTYNANATLLFNRTIGLTGALFATSGTADTGLYPADPVEGSISGSPDSNGFMAQFDYNPWQNMRLALQYVLYGKFNGASSNYDGTGRNAANNDALFLMAWLAF
jgi:hypothetical protein